MAKRLKYIPILIVSMMAACCAANKQVNHAGLPPPESRSEFVLHRVLPGETLASIAKRYTGKESDWRELAKANPNLEPRRLRRGDLVKVPLRIASVRKSPPEHSTAFRKHRKAIGRTTRSKGNPPALPEEVFGPR